MHCAVFCGEALHVIPADGYDVAEDDSLVVHGREDHAYGTHDWDVLAWADTKEALMDAVSRTRISRRMQD